MGKLCFGIGKLLLRIFQFCLSVINILLVFLQFCQVFINFFINRAKHLLIDCVNLFLTDNNIHALFQKSHTTYRSHALDTLQFRHNGIICQIRNFCCRHILSTDCRNHNRQHIRIYFHNNRIPDRIVPVAPDLIQIFTNLKRNGIHICRLGKLQNYHGIIFI